MIDSNKIEEYYDEHAAFWDDNYYQEYNARKIAAMLTCSEPKGCVLDIACGNGAMFIDLMQAGASEIEGIDISMQMIEIARKKFYVEPRISLRWMDVMCFDELGFDAAIMFNAYNHFSDRLSLVNKVHELLVPDGRFTVAHAPGRGATNRMSADLPDSIAVLLSRAEDEAAIWKPYFNVDVICDMPDMFIISGTAY